MFNYLCFHHYKYRGRYNDIDDFVTNESTGQPAPETPAAAKITDVRITYIIDGGKDAFVPPAKINSMI